MKPRNGKVLILPNKPTEVSKGGIIIPEAAKKDQDKGKIVAIGEDITDVSVGDHVLFAKNNVTLMSYEGINYVMANIDDIMGVINNYQSLIPNNPDAQIQK